MTEAKAEDLVVEKKQNNYAQTRIQMQNQKKKTLNKRAISLKCTQKSPKAYCA